MSSYIVDIIWIIVYVRKDDINVWIYDINWNNVYFLFIFMINVVINVINFIFNRVDYVFSFVWYVVGYVCGFVRDVILYVFSFVY